MSLQPQPHYVIPAETAKVTKAIFPKGNLCITMADQLGYLDADLLVSSQTRIKWSCWVLHA